MSSDPIKFHDVCGRNIRLSNDKCQATRCESFNEALCFTNRPLKPGEKLVVKITETCNTWNGTLRVGVTAHDPRKLAPNLPKFMCPDLNNREGNWGKALEDNFVQQHKEFEVYYKLNGTLLIKPLNGRPQEFLSDVKTITPLYVLFDIYGNTQTIEISQRNSDGRTPNTEAPETIVEGAEASPIEPALFRPYNTDVIQVGETSAKSSPSVEPQLAVVLTKLKAGYTLTARVKAVTRPRPMSIVLSTEPPDAIYADGDVESLCETTYSLKVESELLKPDDSVAVSIAPDGWLFIVHNNTLWSKRFQLDASLEYHVVFCLGVVLELSLTGLTRHLIPSSAMPVADEVVALSTIPTVTEKQQADAKASPECIVCFENPRCIFLEPCCHLALCQQCADKVMQESKRECPVCRHAIRSTKKVFLA